MSFELTPHAAKRSLHLRTTDAMWRISFRASSSVNPKRPHWENRRVIASTFTNQSLAALANPHSSLSTAHLWHSQSEFGVPTAQTQICARWAMKQPGILPCPALRSGVG